MSDFIKAGRLLWCHGLAQTRKKPTQSVQQWLSSAAYAPDTEGGVIVLRGIEESDLLKAVAYDINRLSSAASETLCNIVEIPTFPKSLAWPYVKLYYAALFYAHTLLRIWGVSPSYFRTSDLIYLRNTIKAYDITAPFSLNSGQYKLIFDIKNDKVILSNSTNGKGAHEALWHELINAFVELKGKVTRSLISETERLLLVQEIDRAVNLITNGNRNNAWLSYMRNEIQYRQAEGVWYPYSRKARALDLAAEVASVIDGSTKESKFLIAAKDDLAQFEATCLFVISFARNTLADVSKISGSDSFLIYGQARFESSKQRVKVSSPKSLSQ